jgi:hypothetical protein
MRRSILVAASGIALAAAALIVPFGATAAAPYVYGCTPATIYNTDSSTYIVSMTIYNGTASSAHLTHKILEGNGSILNQFAGGAYVLPLTSVLTPTSTAIFAWGTFGGRPGIDAARAASVRIVSDVPIVASLSHDASGLHTDQTIVQCLPILP